MANLALLRASKNVIDGATQSADLELSADVCVIGSGPGGAVTASILAQAKRDVILLEEGAFWSHLDFDMREEHTGPKLYQDGMQRATSDLAISVLQGRAVGGTTVVNWTTSFRTPEDVVRHWAEKHGVRGFKYEELGPHYDAIEARLNIQKVDESAMNKNNRKLFEGCKALGLEAETTRRNVYQCMQTGYCGTGCPINAKRSMLVTLVPDALEAGARLVHRCRVDRLEISGGRVVAAICSLLGEDGYKPTGKTARVRARTFVVSGGAINSPALLLRSGLDAGGLVGRRTFLHPVIASIAEYDEPIEAFYGAPQTAVSHAFAHRGDKVGVFLEAAPAYPMVGATAIPSFGELHRAWMTRFNHLAIHIAISIDGFHDDVQGGTVRLRPSGAPLLDYPLVPRQWEAFRFAQDKLARVQLASGAKRAMTLHDPGIVVESEKDLPKLESARWEPCSVGIFTAHQMGGCAMGDDPSKSVVRSEDLRMHDVANLHVIDGSVFPTSLGVNPQESILGLSRLMATRLAATK